MLSFIDTCFAMSRRKSPVLAPVELSNKGLFVQTHPTGTDTTGFQLIRSIWKIIASVLGLPGASTERRLPLGVPD